MTLHIGKAEKGTYIARIPSTGACRNYFFKFTDTTGTAYRYPQEGAFVIFGDGLCTQNYTGALSFRSRTPEKNPGIKRIVRVFKAGKVLIGVSVPGLNGYYDIRGLHLRPGRQAGSLFRHAPGL